MLRRVSVVLLSAGALALGACSSSTTTPDSGTPAVSCTGTPQTCTIPVGAPESQIDAAIAAATAGTTFVFGAGTFTLTNGFTLPAGANITIQGAGMAYVGTVGGTAYTGSPATILDFSGETGSQGIGITASLGNSNLKIQGLTIRNTPGDGIKVENANGAAFEQVNVLWANAADGGATTPSSHGSYGIYPVQSQYVLADHCVISGAQDTGIYVGQSNNIILSNNLVYQNVAGIEIESSVDADVEGNEATQNTVGIAVFGLPGLMAPQFSDAGTDGTLSVRVYNNNVHDNNTVNFATPGDIVWYVPGGTGMFVMASAFVEVFGNTVANNNTIGYGVVSYILFDQSYTPSSPTDLNPFPNNVWAHNNVFSGNGSAPISSNLYALDGGSNSNQYGELFGYFILEAAWSSTPDLDWDGIGPPGYLPPDAGVAAGTPPNPLGIWFSGNQDANNSGGAASFANLNLPIVCIPCSIPAAPNGAALNTNEVPFTNAAPPGFPLPGVDAGAFP
ncbi:MAG: parallel beta-helix domain-containing protein [Myxococcaceae bacterium]